MQYNMQPNMGIGRMPQVRNDNRDDAQKERSRVRALTIKKFLRDHVTDKIKTGSLTMFDFMTVAKMKYEQRGAPAEQIAATLSDTDCITLFAYYSDMVTRDEAKHALTAYGAGFLARQMIINDGLALDAPNNISASKLLATASLMLYQRAIFEFGFSEYSARVFLTRDSFYIYSQRLGRVRMMDGQLSSNYWKDAVKLTQNNPNGWNRVLFDYNRPQGNSIPNPDELRLWWNGRINTANANSACYYLDIIGAINKKLARWKVVCLIGYLKCERILTDAEANLAYTMVYNEFVALGAANVANHQEEHFGNDDGRKINEYAVYFNLAPVESNYQPKNIPRLSFFGDGHQGNLFDDKDGARPKRSMKSLIASL